MTADYEVGCPMPDCTEPLDVLFDGLATLEPKDLVEDLPVPIGDVLSMTWRVECRAGHVILIPTEDTNCGCDDDRVPAADHEHWAEDESFREFNGRDMARLRTIIATIGGAS